MFTAPTVETATELQSDFLFVPQLKTHTEHVTVLLKHITRLTFGFVVGRYHLLQKKPIA